MLRLVIGANGLMIAYFGNRAPKAARAERLCAADRAGVGLVVRAERPGLCRPVGLRPDPGGNHRRLRRVIAAGIIVTIGYCFWLRGQAQAQKDGRAA